MRQATNHCKALEQLVILNTSTICSNNKLRIYCQAQVACLMSGPLIHAQINSHLTPIQGLTLSNPSLVAICVYWSEERCGISLKSC